MRLPQSSNTRSGLTWALAGGYCSLRTRDDPRPQLQGKRWGAGKETEMLLWNYLVRLIRRWQAYDRTYRELMQLSDRELRDIRVSRSEIESIALEAARSAR
jgi:uncharacterized protein YjiS (DUF1127 family)